MISQCSIHNPLLKMLFRKTKPLSFFFVGTLEEKRGEYCCRLLGIQGLKLGLQQVEHESSASLVSSRPTLEAERVHTERALISLRGSGLLGLVT